MEFIAPLFARMEVDEEFSVIKAARVTAVVGPSDLTDDLLNFGEVGKNETSFLCHGDAGGRSSAGGESAADPDRTFVEVWKEFGTDDSTHGHEEHYGESQQSHAESEVHVVEAPVEGASVGAVEPLEDGVAPFLDSGAEEDAAKDRCNEQ